MDKSPAPVASPVLTGVFAGPIAGLKYQTPTLSGLTTDDGDSITAMLTPPAAERQADWSRNTVRSASK